MSSSVNGTLSTTFVGVSLGLKFFNSSCNLYPASKALLALAFSDGINGSL